MKKNLRLLCLGLATAAFTASFAQAENVTDKLGNSSFEWGVAGWDIEFENQIWGKSNKAASSLGHYGFSGTNLQVWNGNVLKENSISQTVTGLPNGTYVFGAYVGASYNLSTPAKPAKEEGETDEAYEARVKEWQVQYDSIRAIFVADSVFGVKMFANLDEIPVATEHPDRTEEKRHTVKFNVATKVTDGKLTVGLAVDSTNASYVCWDEVELYYFGDMDAAAALNEMAKIDAKKPLAISDTVVGKHMSADTLSYLKAGIEAAKAVATPADFTAADEHLRWAVILANRSVNDYNRLSKKIAQSNELVASKDDWFYPEDLAATQAVIAYAQGLYDNKSAHRAVINEAIDSLTLSCALLQFDNLELALEELNAFISDNAAKFGDNVGEYPTYWKDSLNALAARVAKVVEAFSAETAIEDIKLVNVINASIEACMNSEVVEFEGELTALPLVTLTEDDGTISNNLGNHVYEFKSETYTNDAPIVGLRFTFLDTYCPNGAGKGNPPFVALSEFFLFDGAGNQIALSESNFHTNAQEASEGPMANICDGNYNTYWHSDWHGNVSETHYLEVTIGGGLNLKEFSFGWRSRHNQGQNIPSKVEVSIMTYVAKNKSALIASIADAKQLIASTPVGTAVGYYNVDIAPLTTALATAEELIAAGASEDDCLTALNALNDAMDVINDTPMILPEAGKEYRIISAAPFFANQGKLKTLAPYAYGDPQYTNHVWWENVGKDSLDQAFTFEPLEDNVNEEGAKKLYYAVKNVKTGMYLGCALDTLGEEMINRVALFAQRDTIELVSFGAAEFALLDKHNGDGGRRIHCEGHNGGSSSTAEHLGGIRGVYGPLVHWGSGAGSASAWYICEMNELPLTALVEGATYQSPLYHFYEGVSVVAFTADKETAFENFVVKGLNGQPVEVQLDQMGNTMLVTLSQSVWAFSFSFDNKEGVTKVEVGPSKLGDLRDAYDAAIAVAPQEGTGVGQYADLKDYNAAIATAEDYFKKGATDEQIDAAIKAIEDATAELVPNMPAADKQYYIISALSTYEENHYTPMAIYARQTKNESGDAVSYARWSYISSKPVYHWRFIEVDKKVATTEAQQDTIYYRIQNVGTGEYLMTVAQSAALQMTDSLDLAGKYVVTMLGDAAVNINLNNKINEHKCLHTGGHGGGSGTAGSIVGWEGGLGTASSWYISEVEAVITDLDFTEIDDNDEQVAPKGIYDLFGRRVINPTAAGIYIIDGKKRVIK